MLAPLCGRTPPLRAGAYLRSHMLSRLRAPLVCALFPSKTKENKTKTIAKTTTTTTRRINATRSLPSGLPDFNQLAHTSPGAPSCERHNLNRRLLAPTARSAAILVSASCLVSLSVGQLKRWIRSPPSLCGGRARAHAKWRSCGGGTSAPGTKLAIVLPSPVAALVAANAPEAEY